MLRLGVISDTHIPSRSRVVPPAVFEVFQGVDAILHAGDVNVRDALIELEAIAPVHGVLGNNDDWSLHGVLPEQARLEFGENGTEGPSGTGGTGTAGAGTGAAGGPGNGRMLTIGMIHNSGASQGRRRRMSAAFPGCRVVVFGHSHQPMVEDDGSLLLLNPGSAVDPRRARIPTVAILEIDGGQPKATLIELPKPAGASSGR